MTVIFQKRKKNKAQLLTHDVYKVPVMIYPAVGRNQTLPFSAIGLGNSVSTGLMPTLYLQPTIHGTLGFVQGSTKQSKKPYWVFYLKLCIRLDDEMFRFYDIPLRRYPLSQATLTVVYNVNSLLLWRCSRSKTVEDQATGRK